MSAQKRKNFKEKIGGAYVIICPETLEIQNNFVILHRRSRRMTICLFHGVMVSTRVFGSLSPRSSRSGTTARKAVRNASATCRRSDRFFLCFAGGAVVPFLQTRHARRIIGVAAVAATALRGCVKMQILTRTQRCVRMVKMQGAEDEGAGSVLKYMTKPEDDSNAADWPL